MQEPLARHINSLHDWHIVSDIDLQGLDLKDSGLSESNMKQGEGDTNRQVHVLETPETQKQARSETSDKGVLYFYGGLTVVGVLLTMVATRRNPPLPSSEVTRTGWRHADDGACGNLCSSSGNQVVPGIVYPTTDWNHTQYLPPGSSYSMYERMEKLEMESLRMQQELKSHSAAISDMDGRLRALEAYIFGSSRTGVNKRLDTLKNQIDSLSKDVSQGNNNMKHIDGKPSPKSLQILQNSESLTNLQEKVEHLELWLETLQHSSQTISSRLDSEMASITEDVATLAERLHHVENHVHVSEDLL